MTCCGSRPSDWTPARSRAGRRCDFTTVLYLLIFLSLWLVNNFLCGSRNYLWFCFKRRSISFWHSFVVFFLRQIRSKNPLVRFSVRRLVAEEGPVWAVDVGHEDITLLLRDSPGSDRLIIGPTSHRLCLTYWSCLAVLISDWLTDWLS